MQSGRPGSATGRSLLRDTAAGRLRRRAEQSGNYDLFQQSAFTVQQGGELKAESLDAALATNRPVAIAFDWGHMCLVYGKQNDKYLMYDPYGPASGTLSLTGIKNYGPGSSNWQTSWTGL
jgi:hypothetical protein